MKTISGIVLLTILFGCFKPSSGIAQDTFSIVGLDTLTGEVGSAGASCVDLIQFGITNIGFLGDLFPGKGAINTQASYLQANQANARVRMLAGDTPTQIVTWLQANDVNSDPSIRQYGVVAMVSGSPQTAAHTGSNCMNYKNHITGRNYSIQGNILLGQNVLDSMEKKFKNTPGTLACKLMAALQGAKMIGADTRCAPNNVSSLFAFLKVSKNDDPDGSPYISIGVRTATNTFIEPIDSLQSIANSINLCSITTGISEKSKMPLVTLFPNPANDKLYVLNYSSATVNKIIIHDAVGRKCMEAEDLSTALDISSLPAGMYLAEVRTKDGQIRKTMRFVKE